MANSFEVEIPEELYRELEDKAKVRGMSITDYVFSLLSQLIHSSDK